ncbi:MAG: tRNA pseudouridine(38-40) synthase TruA [Spirochaetes bacterium]|nr:tRNA pseudouridine(38-40) synthase TruA [Spirochaetota bacterium]
MRFRLALAYDGAAYTGFQKQATGDAVQNVLDAALERLFGAPVRSVYSGRTDQGVHADEQVLFFEADLARIPLARIPLILNGDLPPDIRVLACDEAPPGFHPRYSARVRLYEYRLIARRTPSARALTERLRAWNPGVDLEADLVRDHLEPLLGAHDFTAFCAVQDPSPTKWREIFAVDAWREGPILTIQLWGNAFLRNQVRAIIGNLVRAIRRREPVGFLGTLLETRDPLQAKPRAPAHGLVLKRVFYSEIFGDRPYYHPTLALPAKV